MSKKYYELASANVFELSDKDLKKLVTDCIETRKGFMNATAPSVNQMNQQIELAQFELSSRQSQRLSRLSLAIATLAIVASAVSVIL